MAQDAKTSLGESELLLILDMCNEGIENCHAREKEHLRVNNDQAAEWDRRLRERYLHLRSEVLGELEQRQRAITAQAGKGDPPEATPKSHNDAPSQ